MKKFLVCLLCFSMLITNVSAAESSFNDIEGHWAEETIKKFQDYGYINGYPDGSFKPDNYVTRAELAKILSSAFDLQEGEPPEYSDVSEEDWFYPYLIKSARYIPVYSLITGYDANMPYILNNSGFLPDTYTLRMHLAEALVTIKIEMDNIEEVDNIKVKDPENLTIQEVREISRQVREVFNDGDLGTLFYHVNGYGNVWRMNIYAWLAYKLDIMEGYDGYFDPYGYVTRAALLTTIDRVMEK